ncbi:hypothetical protein NL676_025909 [Syzygium grande]|nr:hypothetical protein NL676_025909 [Syzygium grande]
MICSKFLCSSELLISPIASLLLLIDAVSLLFAAASLLFAIVHCSLLCRCCSSLFAAHCCSLLLLVAVRYSLLIVIAAPCLLLFNCCSSLTLAARCCVTVAATHYCSLLLPITVCCCCAPLLARCVLVPSLRIDFSWKTLTKSIREALLILAVIAAAYYHDCLANELLLVPP